MLLGTQIEPYFPFSKLSLTPGQCPVGSTRNLRMRQKINRFRVDPFQRRSFCSMFTIFNISQLYLVCPCESMCLDGCTDCPNSVCQCEVCNIPYGNIESFIKRPYDFFVKYYLRTRRVMKNGIIVLTRTQ